VTGGEAVAQIPPGGSTRRDLAVARVVDPARARAETRVQRFLDAALDLMNSASGKEFTVQEVVERSGQSLRSFYQYFDGKHELLLALFEDAVRTTAEQITEQVDAESDPLERLHVFVVDYYKLCRPPVKGRAPKRAPVPALAEFAQQLLTDHPQEASKAFVPLVELCERLLTEAVDAGAIREQARIRRVAGFVLQAVMFNAFVTTISGSWSRDGADSAAEDMWDLLYHGLKTTG
jgi:AcrR family transcriptional regulator